MNVVPNLILRLNLSISESQCKKLSIKFIMDDYMTLNMTTYTGDNYKQQQYATETKVNKEDHREVMTANLEAHNINRISLGTSEKHPQKNSIIGEHRKMTKILIAMLLAVILFVSLGASVLSIINFLASGNTSLTLNANNDDVTSLAATIKNNISQLGIQLDALDSLAIIEVANIARLHCGDGLWHRIAHLNMSNPSQKCPPAWREYNGTSNIRVCGRPDHTLLFPCQ